MCGAREPGFVAGLPVISLWVCSPVWVWPLCPSCEGCVSLQAYCRLSNEGEVLEKGCLLVHKFRLNMSIKSSDSNTCNYYLPNFLFKETDVSGYLCQELVAVYIWPAG